MRSKTSFFNFTLFWKDVSRFWPVWGGYLAIWTLLGPLTILGNRYSYGGKALRAANHVLELGYVGGVIMGFIFAVLAAMAVWSFAYRTRSAHAMASLPVRREGMFTALGLAGLLPLLAANVLTVILLYLTELLMGCVDWISLGWFLLLTSLPLLFFYGLATFCAQLTGNILVLPALYLLLNFLVPALELLVRTIGGMLVFGMRQGLETFSLLRLSPLIGMLRYGGVGSYYYTDPNGVTTLSRATVNGWGMLGIYAGVGVVLLVLALLLFRRRRMESAGDVVAVNVLKPVFRWCMAFGCAMGLGLLLYAVIDEGFYNGARFSDVQMAQLLTLTLLMFLGAFVGWFVAQMLIKKSFRVFRSHWVGYGVCCLVIALAMFATEFDLFGFERRVPDPERVERVELECYNGSRVTLSRPESLEAVTALHRSIVGNKAQYESGVRDNSVYLELTYHLNNGRTMFRHYSLYYDWEQPGDVVALQALINSPEATASRKETPFPINADTVTGGSVQVLLSAGEGAALDGYDSPEDWILTEVCGYSPEELALLDEAARENALADAVYNRAYNSMDFLAQQMDMGDWPVTEMSTATETAPNRYDWLPDQDWGGYIPLEDIDLSQVLFYHTFEFSIREMVELYETCILPDIQDGTLGRVYILNVGAYYREATGVEISIDAKQTDFSDGNSDPDAPSVEMGERYHHFYTTATVDSSRTNAWLEAHDIPVHSLAEILNVEAALG